MTRSEAQAPPPRDDARAVALPDGRMLEFADYGDPHGHPVVAHHGTHDSHLTWRLADDACRAAGVRLIAPDRPGYGGSTPAPQRRILDWPADFVALVDALGLETVAVMSLREGVAYAAAAAVILPDRIDDAVLIASRRPEPRSPARPAPRDHGGPDAVRFAELFLRCLPEPDRRLMADGSARALLAASIAAATRDPAGIELDTRLGAQPWGFDLADLTAPTVLWQGGRDGRNARATSLWLREQLPHAPVLLDPDRASFSLLERVSGVLDLLLDKQRSS